MSEFKGTKGKWKLRNEHNLIFVESPKEEIKQPYGQEILADDYFNEEEKIYDALLISKAPEMLEMLKDLGGIFDKYSVDFESEFFKYKEPIQQLIKSATEL
jgi:hypothetical protein